MIKLESAHIEEVRGIRKLDIGFGRATFVISGPNGSGKSGVIDAIEFALTGNIGRLTGRGTKGLTVTEHGPHVDRAKFPDAAFVELKVFLPELGKSATITRKVSAPKKPKIVPADDDVKAALAEIADHPEVTLSRREILRFILVEPTKRSEEIQSILKLDEIGETRSALFTAQNKVQSAQRTADGLAKSSREALALHLQIPSLRAEDLVEAVNKRRRVLGLPEILELTAESRLDADLSSAEKAEGLNKQSALRDLNTLAEAAKGFPGLGASAAAGILANLATLESDTGLLEALQRRDLIERGLSLVNGADCPLCGKLWEDEENLRLHLKAKLTKSTEAEKVERALAKDGTAIAQQAIAVVGMLGPAQRVAEAQGEAAVAQVLAGWKADLEGLRANLTTVSGLAAIKDRLTSDWLRAPTSLTKDVERVTARVQATPDQTATLDAQTFLTTAQVRLGDYREAMRKSKVAGIAYSEAAATYEAYCSVLEDELNALYDEVQEDFSTLYRTINHDDEATFTAKLTPSEGKLDFDVNFYERGLFPPGAYHSEGHQDGMGVCLYLALMKRLFGKRFTFALLDDVVMSVDSDHRYQFCKLLKASFPDTQFIITTHDRLWAEQMKSAGLVSAKTSIAFHSWTIDTGPLVESNEEIWDEISRALSKGKVEAAAAALRHHLEYVSRNLADLLGATPHFRADGNYELGELLPSVLTRVKELYGKAAAAAQSWGNSADKEAALKRRGSLAASAATQNVEQWAVNKAVHYNEWANFGKKDFEPVVAAFKDLLRCCYCDACGGWLYVTPRVNPESLRCGCNATNLNLKGKPK